MKIYIDALDSSIDHFDREYYDIALLINRGWTKTLIKYLLGDEDERCPVDHFANFQGKCLFLKERVNLIEQSEQFENLFLKSANRRKFSTRAKNIILRQVIKKKI